MDKYRLATATLGGKIHIAPEKSIMSKCSKYVGPGDNGNEIRDMKIATCKACIRWAASEGIDISTITNVRVWKNGEFVITSGGADDA